MQFQAHKGVSTEYPENTMPAFQAAVEQGYDNIELDVSVTADQRFVILHDRSINRTARNQDGSSIIERVAIADITYEEALQYDFGCAFHKKFKGTKIAALEEVLHLVQENHKKIKLDNKFWRFSEQELDAFFRILKPYEKYLAFTCDTAERVRLICEGFPESEIHYDGPITEEILQQMSAIVERDKLVVWLPVQNQWTEWVKIAFAEEERCRFVKKYAKLGLWILSEYREYDWAEKVGADIIETDGQIKPDSFGAVWADMHTHTKYSHDSRCEVTDLCRQEIQKGMNMVAITDHCDIQYKENIDLMANAGRSYEAAKEADHRFGTELKVLTGIELGEGIWFPEECERIANAFDFDVRIGAVHAVRYREYTMPYSQIDFSEFQPEEIAEYIHVYLDDVMESLRLLDYDILAHLMNPVKYIEKTAGISVQLSQFDDKISEILQYIIKHGMALEVNTAALQTDYQGLMPGKEILQKYREMGGYLITLGSDAHIAENGAKGFEEAVSLLKELGFRKLFYYEGRKSRG